jgi:hypothetical protein
MVGILHHRHAGHGGRRLFSISSHLPAKLCSKMVKPVMLPPGLARLATKPSLTGSDTISLAIESGHKTDLRRCNENSGPRRFSGVAA